MDHTQLQQEIADAPAATPCEEIPASDAIKDIVAQITSPQDTSGLSLIEKALSSRSKITALENTVKELWAKLQALPNPITPSPFAPLPPYAQKKAPLVGFWTKHLPLYTSHSADEPTRLYL